MRTKIMCKNCGQEMRQKRPYDKKVKGDVRRIYIKCESCGKEYTLFFTNTEIRKLQKEQRNLLSQRNTNLELEKENLKQVRKNAQRISEIMEGLRAKYESV